MQGKRLRDWKSLEFQKIRQMWGERCARGIHAMAICNKCGGSSISTCECAYERWVRNLTQKEFEEWGMKDHIPDFDHPCNQPVFDQQEETGVQKFCTQCGSSKIDKFCGSCGVKIK